MKVLIDVTALARPNPSGIALYVKQLVKHLSALPNMELSLCYKLSRIKKLHYLKARGLTVQPFIPFVSDLNLSKFDVFHGPDFKLIAGTRYKRVTTIHDVIVMEEGLSSSKFIKEGREKLSHIINVQQPEAIITVSEFSKSRLQHFFPNYKGQIFVTHPGVEIPPTNNVQAVKTTQPYIFCSGTLEKRKNIIRLIDAFGIVKQQIKDIQLVIAGGDGFEAAHIHQAAAQSPFSKDIVLKGYVDDNTLYTLYSNAAVFVYPSVYEGFGLPILEAMQAGCPVICSNFGAMAEVAGDAALTCNVELVDSIAHSIVQVLDDVETRKKFQLLGKKRAQQFSWLDCAQKTQTIYNQICR